MPQCASASTQERALIELLSLRGRLRAYFVNFDPTCSGRSEKKKREEKKEMRFQGKRAIFIALRRMPRTEMQSTHDEKASRSPRWFTRVLKFFDAS